MMIVQFLTRSSSASPIASLLVYSSQPTLDNTLELQDGNHRTLPIALIRHPYLVSTGATRLWKLRFFGMTPVDSNICRRRRPCTPQMPTMFRPTRVTLPERNLTTSPSRKLQPYANATSVRPQRRDCLNARSKVRSTAHWSRVNAQRSNSWVTSSMVPGEVLLDTS